MGSRKRTSFRSTGPDTGDSWPDLFCRYRNRSSMENLSTETVETDNAEEEFVLQEKDQGDAVVYDIYRKGHCLMTLSDKGHILFMDLNVTDGDRELFELSRLNEFIGKVVTVFHRKMMLV